MLVVLIGLALNALLGMILFFYVLYLRLIRRAYLSMERVTLGRCVLITLTSQSEILYRLAYLIDGVSLLLLVLQFAILPSARENCASGFLAFLYISTGLQTVTLIRMFLFCVHFRRGQQFYYWLKQKFLCLQTVEGEDRLSLDIYSLPAYVAKIKG